jgi:hypothetical protein
MNTIMSKTIGTGIIFLLVFLTGYWLSRSGKPYHTIIFTAHKLIALGGVIFLATLVYRFHQITPLLTAQAAVVMTTAFLLVALVITGGLLSVEKVMPEIVQRMHQVLPYLAVISIGVTFYLLLIRGNLTAPV